MKNLYTLTFAAVIAGASHGQERQVQVVSDTIEDAVAYGRELEDSVEVAALFEGLDNVEGQVLVRVEWMRGTQVL